MIYLKNDITIRDKKENVYNFLSNFENIPFWNYYVKEVYSISNKERKTNLYRQIRKNDSQTFKVIKQNFPKEIKIETISGSKIQFRRTFKLSEDNKANCKLQDNFEIDLGSPKIFQLLFKSKIKKAIFQNLTKLNEILENGSTVLQDGRVMNATT